jgi:hypothetical protein
VSHPKRLEIPILKFIDLGINHNPTHRIFDNVKVIRYVVLRYRIFEVIFLVKTNFGHEFNKDNEINKRRLAWLFFQRLIVMKYTEGVMRPPERHERSPSA